MQKSCQTVISGVEYFLTRNYRKRLFQQSDIYKKYLDFIKKHPSQELNLNFASNTIRKEHQELKLFSNLIGIDANVQCLEEYKLGLIELMMDENVTNILEAIKSLYAMDFEHDAVFDLQNIFYIPSKYYFCIHLGHNAPPVYISLNITNEDHVALSEKLESGKITLSYLKNSENKHFVKIADEFIADAKKNEYVDVLKLDDEEICLEINRVNELYYFDVLVPNDNIINDCCNELNEYLLKLINDNSILTKHKIFFDDINHILKMRELLFNYENEIEYNSSKFHSIQSIQKVLNSIGILDLTLEQSIDECEKIKIKNYKDLKAKFESFKKLHTLTTEKYFNILKHCKVYDTVFHEIDESDYPQIWEDIKTRVIGIYLYDLLPSKKTIPEDILRKDEVLMKFGYTANDKQKLNNYLNTARRCIKYGMIMPTKS